ncbi:retrovirus-related pol polyprotein from transposon TNT 1-94 [Tanacetum coccineum]
MSTSKTYQQSLADAGPETRPPMLEMGSYIPWVILKLQTADDLQGDALLHYDAEMELINLILLSFPNDIYNSVDACTSDKDMWNRFEREALVSVYNRFAQLMNDLERNDMHFPIVTINTKFLNSLQPEWLKYVTQVRLAKRLTVDTFDDLFDYLQQFEKLVNVSRAKKLEKSHDPLALVAHTGSSSRNTSSYYVTHPTSVVDYEDEYQQDDVHTNSEDPLTSAMLLLARAITQNFSTPTNNRLRTSSNTRNQAIIQGDRVNIQSRNSDLEAKLKKNVDLILKLGNSLQGMFMLGPKPLSVYDLPIKKILSLGYPNPYTLKQAISQCPKLYLASSLGNSEISLNIRDNEDTLDDASKSQQKFDKTNGSQPLLCVTPLHKYVIQKKTDVQKSEENHVVLKPVTLQTSPAKQRGVNSNKNVIAPGIYKVVTTHESQTNEAKHDLSSTGMNAASSVRRPMNRDSHVKNSVLANSKKPAKKVAVCVRKNKQTDNTSENVISKKENVIDVDVANASKAKTLLCVSCMQNMLIPCHANCFANYKLNVHSNVRKTLSTKSRIPKSYDTTYVVHKTRFSKESTLSKSLETTYVVSKPEIDVGSTSKANDKVVQIVLWIVDSGCSKHMTGDRSLLKNFIEKFIGTVRFGNDNFAAITGYGDYIQGNITICHVYYVEGLGHNLFSVGQFCDGDLEVAFRSKTCYVRNLEGDDLLTGGRESNLYTISISDMAASSPVCLMSKATSTKSWLWHRRLSHLNFGTINDLTRLDLVDGLPKFKYGKDHLCSACERGKSKKASHPLKLVPSDHSKLELLHMDLCGPMRIASINGKKYILVIVDDYSRYTWVYFLHSKDETPEIIKKFIAQAQLNYKAKVCKIRTDNGTEFKNATLKAHYEKLGIMQQFSTARTPQQNGVVERRNRTLVEAARTMLIFSRLPEFLWAEAVATTCFTQNRSIIHTRHNKTPYELLRGRKPNVEYFHVFGSLCYPTNDRDDLGKMKPKADIGVFIGYSETSKADTINTLSKEDLDNLFGPMFEEYFEKRSFDTPINSAAPPTQFHETPPIETASDEQTSPISLTNADDVNQEDYADFNGNLDFVPYNASSHEEIKSSMATLEP